MKQLMLMVSCSNSFGYQGLGDFSILDNGQLGTNGINLTYTGLSIAIKNYLIIFY